MERVFLSFADSRMRRAAMRIRRQAEAFGAFDRIVVEDERALRQEELAPWRDFFAPGVRGYGYWCWKPYLIRRTLRALKPGDILLYCDAGSYLNPQGMARYEQYLHLLQESPLGILAFEASEDASRPYLERQWTKGDVFAYFACAGNPAVTETPQVAATQILLRHCPAAFALLEAWNEAWMGDRSRVDDSPSATPNAPDFSQHRHDQSLFSVLYKLHGGTPLPYYEKYAADWETMRGYPLWAMRDRGRHVRGTLRLVANLLLARAPFESLRRCFRPAAWAMWCRRPYLQPYVPSCLHPHKEWREGV